MPLSTQLAVQVPFLDYVAILQRDPEHVGPMKAGRRVIDSSPKPGDSFAHDRTARLPHPARLAGTNRVS